MGKMTVPTYRVFDPFHAISTKVLSGLFSTRHLKQNLAWLVVVAAQEN
jgi:hypothetical protein